MGKVDGGAAGGDGGRKSRWTRRFHRFFSCVGLGGEVTSSFDQSDAPTTPPVNQAATAELPSSSACNDSGFRYVAAAPDEPEVPPSSACDEVGFYSATATGEQPEIEVATTGDTGSAPMEYLTASSESMDYVEDYVRRCRDSIKRRETSFPDIFARVPGCRPRLLLDSHAAHLRDLAPWMELSYEAEDPVPQYDVSEFGGVDVTCRHQQSVDEAPDMTDLSFQQLSNTQVQCN